MPAMPAVLVGKAAAGGAPMPGGGASGGYRFDETQIDGIIQQWEDLLADLEADERDAESLAKVKAPGREFASGDFVSRANPSGKAFLEQSDRMRKYVQQYLDALKNAKKATATTEENAEADIRATGAGQA
ncbi:hypothetical protein SAMN05421810_103589 [Amycolatopsis arida]|uniref:PE family protein n=2 Tax=Amycolatopsis arida TaxID=587909 RepID=A0A1I5TNB6_9PSEU|nr:hypothetical protein CLV69_103168 [Amycolatopsis arida]SFP84533.1 hypothetical protein SAMN05421810_103589 [Amycolatopsis arida]